MLPLLPLPSPPAFKPLLIPICSPFPPILPSASRGRNPQVAVFKRVQDAATGSDRWAYLAHKSPHTHDVRALASAPRGADADELLLSGGVDGQLVVYPAHRILQVRL